MDYKSYEIVLAGLLHDTGKLGQRAFRFPDGLTEISMQLEPDICPRNIYGNYYTHKHVLYTNAFCDQTFDYCPKGLNRERIIRTAIFHHRPETSEQHLLARADRLSAGMERVEDTDHPSNFRYQKRLRSIMQDIRIDKDAENHVWEHPLEPLSAASDVLFPRTADTLSQDQSQIMEDHYRLWKNLMKAWKQNRVSDPFGFINRAVSILERYCWCVPAALNALPDISLFDHLKTTAAIAACLYSADDKHRPFHLFCGDFSGIQSYIFDIKGGSSIAKRLRARSFYVSLLSDFVAYRILFSLNLPLTNCLMASGGRFYLLLPNNNSTLKILKEIKIGVDNWSLSKLNGEIQMNLAWVPLSEDGINNFSDSIRMVNDELTSAKKQPFKSVLKSEKGWHTDRFLMREHKIGPESTICETCKKFPGKIRKEYDEFVNRCDLCHTDAEVGKKLTAAASVAIYFDPEHQELPGGSFQLNRTKDSISGNPQIIIDFDGSLDTYTELPIITGHMARHIPRKTDSETEGKFSEPMTFEEIADRATGAKKLMCFKADVDNLGYIFGFGFANAKKSKSGKTTPDKASISRMTTLSRMLDMFFSDYFQHLVSNEFPEIYTIYSGGDDVLCLGPWDKTIAFAGRLREDFSRFTCRNPNWSLSAGLVLSHHRMPVITMISTAEHYLEKAKTEKKNSVVLFDEKLSWKDLNDNILIAKQLCSHVRRNKIKRSMIHRLLKYGEMRKISLEDDNNVEFLNCFPMLNYDLQRNWKLSEQDPITTWAHRLLDIRTCKLEKIRFICQFALNCTR